VRTIPFESLTFQIGASDIIIVSTCSQAPIIRKSDVEKSTLQRTGSKRLFIDLSVPRNVAPEVSELCNTVVYDVDHLQNVVINNQKKRQRLMSDIDEIIRDYLYDYHNWLTSRNLGDIISKIRSSFKRINETELAVFKKVKKSKENDLLDYYGDHIAEKYARLLIRNVREVTHNGKREEYIKLLYSLFDFN
jgi:glutamyl-tRNA reductase